MCFKKFMKWSNKCVKRMDMWDIGLVKLATAAFILMIAKLWSGILALPWHVYLIIFILAAIRPYQKMFKK